MDSNSTFASIRTRYTSDGIRGGPRSRRICVAGPAPTFTYHRFWAQSDIALANATMAFLYPNGIRSGVSRGGAKGNAKGKPIRRKANLARSRAAFAFGPLVALSCLAGRDLAVLLWYRWASPF